jgi:hypothetical protein
MTTVNPLMALPMGGSRRNAEVEEGIAKIRTTSAALFRFSFLLFFFSLFLANLTQEQGTNRRQRAAQGTDEAALRDDFFQICQI